MADEENVIKIQVSVECDLTYCSLKSAIEEFIERFGFSPGWFNVNVSIEGLLSSLRIQRMLDSFRHKILIPPKIQHKVYFVCDRNLSPDAWEINAWKDSNKYILYSNGA